MKASLITVIVLSFHLRFDSTTTATKKKQLFMHLLPVQAPVRTRVLISKLPPLPPLEPELPDGTFSLLAETVPSTRRVSWTLIRITPPPVPPEVTVKSTAFNVYGNHCPEKRAQGGDQKHYS